MENFKPYIRPKPPKAGSGVSVVDRFPKVIYGFVDSAARIRTANFRDSGKEAFRPYRNRVIASGLAWGRELLMAPIAVSISTERGRPTIEEAYGQLSKQDRERVLGFITEICEQSPTDETQLRIWYDERDLILPCSTSIQARPLYFYFSNVFNLTPTDIRLVAAYGRVLEETLATTADIEVLTDQKRLFSRRTIIAQLRPNDLLYHGLKRLHKHVSWQRSALVLFPSIDDLENDWGDPCGGGITWQILAERLRGVHQTSKRIGKRYKAVSSASLNYEDLIISDLGTEEEEALSPWARLARDVISDVEDLPADLPSARSALVVYLAPQTFKERSNDAPATDNRGFAIILTDVRKDYFVPQHAHVTRRLFSDIADIVHRSDVVSHRLVKIWMPLAEAGADPINVQNSEVDLKVEDPDDVEALDPAVLAIDTPNVLSVHAIQILQFRRGGVRKLRTEGIDCLQILAIKENNPLIEEVIPVKMVDRTGFKKKLDPASEPLIHALLSNKEFALKDPNGILSKNVLGLFSSRGSHRPFKSIFVVPVRSEGELGGAVIAYRRTSSEFADIDRLLIRALAARIGERIDLRRQLADRARHNVCLNRVAHAKTPAQARLELVKGARELLNADHAFMMASPEDHAGSKTRNTGNIVEVANSWGTDGIHVPTLKIGKQGITGTVYNTGKPFVATDVSTCPRYIPLRKNGRALRMASELSVPIIKPPSLTERKRASAESAVLGVLDTMWAGRHEITTHEVSTLANLAQHAASILQLTTGLADAQQTRDQLRTLLEDVKVLQGLQEEQDVLNWLWSVASKLTNADAMYVWSHTTPSQVIDLIHCRGLRTSKMHKGDTISYRGSWTGKAIRQFRTRGRKSIFDGYEGKRDGVQVPNTPIENYESRLAYCVSPLPTILGAKPTKKPETVWAIGLYRFRKSNFEERERSILQLASEYCEAAIQAISAARAQERTLRLAAATRDIALYLVDNIRTAPDRVVNYILRRSYEELAAYCISVLYYHETGDSYVGPTHFAYPERFSKNPAPRPGGISEVVRNTPGITVVSDIHDPPPELKSALDTSPFLKDNPIIRSMIAGGLYEIPERPAGDRGKFCGIFHINFAHVKRLSQEENLFVSTIQRFLTECGGLEPSLTRMREDASSRIQAVKTPNLVFDEILKVALQGVKAELPSEIIQDPDFRLGGNIYMVEAGDRWALLSIRANVGERTGDHSGRQYIGEGVIGHVASSGKCISVDDVTSEQANQLEYLPYLKDMRSELAVPIRLEDAKAVDGVAQGVVGVLNVECSHRNVFKSRQQDLLFRYASEPPISLILDVAERYGSLLWEAKSSTDRFVSEAASIILHDLTKPIRQVVDKVNTIRIRLGKGDALPYLDRIKTPLKELEDESQKWFKLKDTGFLHLQPEVLEARRPTDVIEQVAHWADFHDPPILIQPHSIKEFFIEQGHPELIARVLENLYSNSKEAAEKAHIPAVEIWLDLKLSEAVGDSQYLNIDFCDNGPGFENLDEARGRVFQHFATRPSAGRWKMGLPCARQMMSAMGGAIELLDSKPRKKTTFRLRFGMSILGLRRSSGVKEDS